MMNLDLLSTANSSALSPTVSSLSRKPLSFTSKSTAVYSLINSKNEWRVNTVRLKGDDHQKK